MIFFCIEEKIQKNYKFQEFQNLLTIEQAKVYKDNGESCISEKAFLREYIMIYV
jgi:hypothetical protein